MSSIYRYPEMLAQNWVGHLRNGGLPYAVRWLNFCQKLTMKIRLIPQLWLNTVMSVRQTLSRAYSIFKKRSENSHKRAFVFMGQDQIRGYS